MSVETPFGGESNNVDGTVDDDGSDDGIDNVGHCLNRSLLNDDHDFDCCKTRSIKVLGRERDPCNELRPQTHPSPDYSRRRSRVYRTDETSSSPFYFCKINKQIKNDV